VAGVAAVAMACVVLRGSDSSQVTSCTPCRPLFHAPPLGSRPLAPGVVGSLTNGGAQARSVLEEEGAHSRGRHHSHRTAGHRVMMREEREAKLQEKRMVTTEPVSAKTEDDYIAARTHLASMRREVADCFCFFFNLVTGPRRSLSLKLSDTRVYEPQIRARLGTTGGG